MERQSIAAKKFPSFATKNGSTILLRLVLEVDVDRDSRPKMERQNENKNVVCSRNATTIHGANMGPVSEGEVKIGSTRY